MTGKKIIDLTLLIQEDIAGVNIIPAKTFFKDGWNATTLQLYSHSGTHMDAPKHFNVNEQSIDLLPVERFISEAWVADIRPLAAQEKITVDHLKEIADQIQPGQSLLLFSDWSKKLGSDAYRNQLPRISKELAHWLVKKRINILGVEPPSVADVNNLEEVTEIHQILMEGDIIIVEGLCNLDAIKAPVVTLIALPLKVKSGDGSPARVVVVENILG